MPGAGFIMRGAKRVFDSRPLYAQLAVTRDCNLDCSYCNEYTRGGPRPTLEELTSRVDTLDRLGVVVYDITGGEPLLREDLPELVGYVKSRKGAKGNLVVVITNALLLTPEKIDALGAAGLDMMQVSVDSVEPTPSSKKALRLVMPRLQLLAERAPFRVKIQSVLTRETVKEYRRLREAIKGFPFETSISFEHAPGGGAAVGGAEFRELLADRGLFPGMRLFDAHADALLGGGETRPWKCLGGSKFLYTNPSGEVQFCSQNETFRKPLEEVGLKDLRANNRHKECEPRCTLGCVRQVSHALGDPLGTLRTSLGLWRRIRAERAEAGA